MSPTLEEQLDKAYQLIQTNRLEECQALCRALETSHPGNPQLAFLFGAVLVKLQKTEAATPYFELAVNGAPEVSEFRSILGDNLRSLGKLEDAAVQYEEALRLKPGQLEIMISLGQIYKSIGQFDQAETVFHQAVTVAPDNQVAIISLARLQRELGNTDEAWDRLENIQDDGSFKVTLANWLLPVIASSLADMTSARIGYEQAIEVLEDQTAEIDPTLLLHAGTNFMAGYQGIDDRRQQEIIGQFFRRNCPQLNYVAPHIENPPAKSDGDKIHIGFVSCSFRNHTVGKLYRGIIAKLDRKIFHVSVFSGAGDDEINHFIRDHCDSYCDLPGDLASARDEIAQAEPDILFYSDIGMDPITYFLAFARLAKVQCVSWGHPVTTGLTTIDYFVSHQLLEEEDPVAAQSHYSEKLILLSQPPTYLYPFQKYDQDQVPDIAFAQNRTLYCCPQALFKIHPEFDSLLIEILQRDGTGVAVFIEGMPGWSDRLKERWRRIDPKIVDRIHFLPRLNQNEFLALVDRADVILDTIYTCGGLSSAEALAHGTPVVTWPNTPLLFGRVTTAYYHQIGVLDCIAGSAREYVEIALRLGQDRKWRDQIAANITANQAKLFKRQEVLDELQNFFINAHSNL